MARVARPDDDQCLRNAPWPQARRAAYDAAAPPTPTSVPLTEAAGATLARDVVALTALPPFDTVTMDGWAVSGRAPWRLVGQQLAGQTGSRLRPGQAVVVATGAQLPRGAEAIVRREAATVEQREDESWVVTHEGATAGPDVRPAGEEAQVGDVLVAAGVVATPPVLGLAAAAGHDSLWIYRPPVVDVFVLGDELATTGLPGPGRVRDALGPQARGWVSSAGATLGKVQAIPDTVAATTSALASSTADLILTTGGTARGPVDQVHPALTEIAATLVVDQVAVRPGHPMLLARRGQQVVIGLPGNPLAAAVGFVSLAVACITAARGLPLPDLDLATTRAPLLAPEASHRLAPVQLTATSAAVTVTPVSHHGPAMLRGLAMATHLAVVPPGGLAAGDLVEVLPLPWVGR